MKKLNIKLCTWKKEGECHNARSLDVKATNVNPSGHEQPKAKWYKVAYYYLVQCIKQLKYIPKKHRKEEIKIFNSTAKNSS